MTKKGLTLIELLMAVSLSAILLGALYAVYSISYQAYKSGINKAELNQNARIAMERMSRDLRQTNCLVTSLPKNINTFNPPSNEIKFQDGHDTEQIQYIRYFHDGTDLKREVTHYYISSDTDKWVEYNTIAPEGSTRIEIPNPAGEARTIADKITSLKFYGSDTSERLINIEITASNSAGTYTYKTIISARNI